MSTGGDYDSALGKSVPGFSIYHFGLDLVAVVSTGDDVWELKVNPKHITYCEISLAALLRECNNNNNNPSLADTELARR